jgi:ATP-dependent DNA helicase RecG
MELTTPVQYLPRVGPALATKLKTLGIETIRDLLYYAPFRYNDYSVVSNISDIRPDEVVTIIGTVVSFRNIFTKNGKRMGEAIVTDATGSIPIIWFNQTYLSSIITPGTKIHFAGKAGWFVKKVVLFSPEYEILQTEQGESLHTGRLVPVYSETQGLSSKWLRGRIASVLPEVKKLVGDYLPEEVKKQYDLIDLPAAFSYIHFPKTFQEVTHARRRLAFDEFFLLQLQSFEQKKTREQTLHAPPFTISPDMKRTFLSLLPFTLTGDQQEALQHISADLQKSIPMNRLLEGDVGSGKTVVAAAAFFYACNNGFSSLFMAPTQILAQQHYDTIKALLGPQGIRVALITAQSKISVAELKNTDVFVGTHALLADAMTYKHIGIIVVDEQQKFGVEQRKLLHAKAERLAYSPHMLTMTATPIPRTIALTVFGNLDLTTLKHPPIGRQKVKTWVVPTQKRQNAYDWIKKELQTHHTQVFVVCPLIEPSESFATVKAVKEEFERLTGIFSSFNLGLLHGRLKPKEKTDILRKFHDRQYDILVTTPVVEVGIDVPNATIMVIEAAERFGLSQLHQLRGRVGRGQQQSYCLLFSEQAQEATLTRLKVLENTHSGPELAEIDLALRGPGDLFGTRQHGLPALLFAKFSDISLIEETQRAVAQITRTDPTLAQFPLLREQVKKSTIELHSQD